MTEAKRGDALAAKQTDERGVGRISPTSGLFLYKQTLLAIRKYDSFTDFGMGEKTGENFPVIEYNRKVALQERQERNHQCQHWSGLERAK